MSDEPKKSNRGFAAMDPEKLKAIAALGGRSLPANKRSFSTNSELARAAGKKGGEAPRKPRSQP